MSMAVVNSTVWPARQLSKASSVTTPWTIRGMSGSTARGIAISGGSATIKCFGSTGFSYDVQRTTSLVLPVTWTTLTASPLTPGGAPGLNPWCPGGLSTEAFCGEASESECSTSIPNIPNYF
jgi:hypothetical protein